MQHLLKVKRYHFIIYPAVAVGLTTLAAHSQTLSQLWRSPPLTESYAIAIDGSKNVFSAGFNWGGDPNHYTGEGCVLRHNPNGKVAWSECSSSTTGGLYPYSYASGVALDSLNNVYVAGAEGDSESSSIGWISKYNLRGKLLWAKKDNKGSYGGSITVDSNRNILVAGRTSEDVWVAKYDENGTLLWAKQFGTPQEDYSASIAADNAGNVLIAGYTEGSLGGPNRGGYDAWVAKYDTDGNKLWIKQLGSDNTDYPNGIAVDAKGDVVVAGKTWGQIGVRRGGAWMAKYSANGTRRWLHQFGATRYDSVYGVTVDADGNIFLAGSTKGRMGSQNRGELDAWIGKYRPTGRLVWQRQWGMSTAEDDVASKVVLDSSGTIFVGGWKGGVFKKDPYAWVAKYSAEGTKLQTNP